MSEEIQLKREVEGTAIPAGTKRLLAAGTGVVVTQDLGGTFTVHATEVRPRLRPRVKPCQ